MKMLLVLTSLVVSANVFALNCDLDVKVEGRETSSKEVIGKGKHNSQYNAQPTSEAKALKDCVEKGGENCEVVSSATACTYHGNGAFLTGGFITQPSYSCSAVAKGTKLVEGKKLSNSEIAANKKAALCERLIKCENTVLNDSEADVKDLEKIDYLKSKNNCEEV